MKKNQNIGSLKNYQTKKGSGSPPVQQGLRLTWDDIANVPVADASSASDWNAFFNLPTNGSPFTSVVIDGNTAVLVGGGVITIPPGLFAANSDLIEVDDQSGVIVACDHDVFNGCDNMTDATLNSCETFGDNCFLACASLSNFSATSATTFGDDCFNVCQQLLSFTAPNAQSLGVNCFSLCRFTTTWNFPNVKTVGTSCFDECYGATSFDLSSCASLGATVGDNGVFFDIIGNTITLTVPAALMTCNAGSPDGDIQYLVANNTVTVIQV